MELNLIKTDTQVSWEMNGKVYTLDKNKEDFVQYDKDENLIEVYLDDAMHFYDTHAKWKMSVDNNTGEIRWEYQGIHSMTVEHLFVVHFYPELGLFLCMTVDWKKRHRFEIYGFDLSGEKQFTVKLPVHYQYGPYSTCSITTLHDKTSVHIACDPCWSRNTYYDMYVLDLKTGVLYTEEEYRYYHR